MNNDTSNNNVASLSLQDKTTKFLMYTTDLVADSTVSILETVAEGSIADSINKFLEGYGKISRQQAEQKAFAEYEKINKTQRVESDFDKETKAFIKAQENKEASDENNS